MCIPGAPCIADEMGVSPTGLSEIWFIVYLVLRLDTDGDRIGRETSSEERLPSRANTSGHLLLPPDRTSTDWQLGPGSNDWSLLRKPASDLFVGFFGLSSLTIVSVCDDTKLDARPQTAKALADLSAVQAMLQTSSSPDISARTPTAWRAADRSLARTDGQGALVISGTIGSVVTQLLAHRQTMTGRAVEKSSFSVGEVKSVLDLRQGFGIRPSPALPRSFLRRHIDGMHGGLLAISVVPPPSREIGTGIAISSCLVHTLYNVPTSKTQPSKREPGFASPPFFLEHPCRHAELILERETRGCRSPCLFGFRGFRALAFPEEYPPGQELDGHTTIQLHGDVVWMGWTISPSRRATLAMKEFLAKILIIAVSVFGERAIATRPRQQIPLPPTRYSLLIIQLVYLICMLNTRYVKDDEVRCMNDMSHGSICTTYVAWVSSVTGEIRLIWAARWTCIECFQKAEPRSPARPTWDITLASSPTARAREARPYDSRRLLLENGYRIRRVNYVEHQRSSVLVLVASNSHQVINYALYGNYIWYSRDDPRGPVVMKQGAGLPSLHQKYISGATWLNETRHARHQSSPSSFSLRDNPRHIGGQSSVPELSIEDNYIPAFDRSRTLGASPCHNGWLGGRAGNAIEYITTYLRGYDESIGGSRVLHVQLLDDKKCSEEVFRTRPGSLIAVVLLVDTLRVCLSWCLTHGGNETPKVVLGGATGHMSEERRGECRQELFELASMKSSESQEARVQRCTLYSVLLSRSQGRYVVHLRRTQFACMPHDFAATRMSLIQPAEDADMIFQRGDYGVEENGDDGQLELEQGQPPLVGLLENFHANFLGIPHYDLAWGEFVTIRNRAQSQGMSRKKNHSKDSWISIVPSHFAHSLSEKTGDNKDQLSRACCLPCEYILRLLVDATTPLCTAGPHAGLVISGSRRLQSTQRNHATRRIPWVLCFGFGSCRQRWEPGKIRISISMRPNGHTSAKAFSLSVSRCTHNHNISRSPGLTFLEQTTKHILATLEMCLFLRVLHLQDRDPGDSPGKIRISTAFSSPCSDLVFHTLPTAILYPTTKTNVSWSIGKEECRQRSFELHGLKPSRQNKLTQYDQLGAGQTDSGSTAPAVGSQTQR
ncbi:hypothetical protein ACRALDRAFT_1091571 [Sodiomyces alcalophilus JCM 7366]|uniref:uncharacterized protein n=1 Tax=Sodiomyces alcalophilus JCM 7366 TaxID=591952 RepID=UPI0039B39B82